MTVSIHRAIIAIFLISFVVLGCGGGEGDINTEDGEYPDGDMEEFIWETSGGGDILFAISHINGQFEISVERYNFQTVDVSIMLTDANLEVFGLVEDIFNKSINIYDYTITPQGDTGTMTKIALKFSGNQELEIKDIAATNDELSPLYDFVIENTEQTLELRQGGAI
jgi:hypothetical protein